MKKFDLGGNFLNKMTCYNFNAMSLEHPRDKKLLLDFLDEMRFDGQHAGNISKRDKNLVILTQSPAVRGRIISKKGFIASMVLLATIFLYPILMNRLDLFRLEQIIFVTD